MTSYSVLPSAQRATVLATWPGPWFDHSANVTTLGDSELAAYLASVLTRLSEDALRHEAQCYIARTASRDEGRLSLDLMAYLRAERLLMGK